MKSLLKKYSSNLIRGWRWYNRIKAHLIRYPVSEAGFEAIPGKKMMEYNKTRIHGAKKLFCYNPFVHMFFNISGHALACCRSHNNVLGKYPEQSIKEIWFGEKYQELREHMLHNDLNMGCEYCKKQLKSNHFHGLPSENPDKFATHKTHAYPQTLELELSNRCNLECVMCSGRVSSSIRKNREQLPPIESPYDDNFVEQLKAFLPHLKEIYFCGGEPFLIDTYYKIWELIIKINPAINLFAVTNGTIYNQEIETILKSTNFNVIVSLDSLDKERYESIRKGARFETVMDNIDKFNHIAQSINISHTPMTINWRDTPEIIDFCNRINARIHLSHLERPVKYALWTLLPNELEEIYKHYDSIEWDDSKSNQIIKYNINVFNEWKERVRYFRDKNAEIYNYCENIDYAKLEKQLKDTLNDFFNHVPDEWMTAEIAFDIITTEISKGKITPAKIMGIKDIINDCDNLDIIHTALAKKFLTNTAKYKAYVKNRLDEEAFWTQYY